MTRKVFVPIPIKEGEPTVNGITIPCNALSAVVAAIISGLCLIVVALLPVGEDNQPLIIAVLDGDSEHSVQTQVAMTLTGLATQNPSITPTDAISATVEPTPVTTVLPTDTQQPTNTPQPTETPTHTPTETATSTYTLTSTPSNTPSLTPTFTVAPLNPQPLRPHMITSVGTGIFDQVTYSDGLAPFSDTDLATQHNRIQRVRYEEQPDGCGVSAFNTNKVWIAFTDNVTLTLNGEAMGIFLTNATKQGYVADLEIRVGDVLCAVNFQPAPVGFFIIWGDDIYFHHDSYCYRGYC